MKIIKKFFLFKILFFFQNVIKIILKNRNSINLNYSYFYNINTFSN